MSAARSCRLAFAISIEWRILGAVSGLRSVAIALLAAPQALLQLLSLPHSCGVSVI